MEYLLHLYLHDLRIMYQLNSIYCSHLVYSEYISQHIRDFHQGFLDFSKKCFDIKRNDKQKKRRLQTAEKKKRRAGTGN